MTFRHQIRVGSRLTRGRSPIDAIPPPNVGETLQAARELKGVDLHRAERDTKIRAKHLAALESGDYTELPGPVYARGFLKNYAAYLGLDADDLVNEWRMEQEQVALPPVPLALPPQPLAEPKGHLRFTRGVFVGTVLVVVIVGFLGYVGLQLLRFAHPPVLTLSGPSVQTLDSDATSFMFNGSVDLPHALITVSGPDTFLQTTDANSLGGWNMEVPVSKGRNDFSITARDPELPPDKGSPALNVILTVPIAAPPTAAPGGTGLAPTPVPVATQEPPPTQSPVESQQPSSTEPPVATPVEGGPAADVAFTSPLEGGQVTPGTVAITGTTNATAVNVLVQWAPPAATDPASPSPTAPPEVPPVPASVAGGSFTANVTLPEGRWVLTAQTVDQPGVLASSSASVTVNALAPKSIIVTVHALDSSAVIKVVADGEVIESGRTLKRHESETYSADQQLTITTDDAGSTAFEYNGKTTGPIGADGQNQTWKFEKGKPPKKG